jgi:MFS family permease
VRTRAFWAISMTHTLANLSVAALSAHLFLHLTDDSGVGLSEAAAGTILVVQTFAAFSFQLICGYLGDRMEKRLLVSGLTLIQGGSLVLLAFAASYPVAVVFALIWGLGFAGRTPVLHSMRGDYFGRKHFGTILGMSGFPMAIGMTVTPVIVGWAYDVQQSYDTTLFVLAGACSAAAVVAQFATRPKTPAQGTGRPAAAEPARTPAAQS